VLQQRGFPCQAWNVIATNSTRILRQMPVYRVAEAGANMCRQFIRFHAAWWQIQIENAYRLRMQAHECDGTSVAPSSSRIDI
jgi:hypothetical protein